MKRSLTTGLALIAALTAGSAALANTGYITGHHMKPDVNGAGHATVMSGNGFATLDRNQDGSISPTEFDQHHAAMSQDRPLPRSSSEPGRFLPEAGNDR